jgi:transcriptional regulator with XRE-family HTH domain
MGIVTKCESGKNAPMTRSLPEVCRRLVATQQALGISPAELSERSDIPPNQWTQFTNPKYKRRITLVAAFKLKDTFGITLEWIFDGDNSRLPHEIANKLKKAA